MGWSFALGISGLSFERLHWRKVGQQGIRQGSGESGSRENARFVILMTDDGSQV